MADGHLKLTEEAIEEAERFLKKAKDYVRWCNESKEYDYYSTERAAMKRASMDLSMILAKLRKPNWTA